MEVLKYVGTEARVRKALMRRYYPMNYYPMNFESAIVPPKALKMNVGNTPTTSGLVNIILNDSTLVAGIAHLEM